MMRRKKWWITLLLIVVLFGLIGCSAQGKDDTYKVHIAINGLNGLFYFAKDKKWFEEEFEKIGAEVVWSEFPSGPPLLESLAAGRVDLSFLGDGPSISSVANGLPVTFISQYSDGLKGANILVVQKNSNAQKLADLKGKKIALAKGTTMHVFFIKAIQKEGLKESDFRIIQLQSDEAVAAFQSGAVDAWVGGDPYISLLEKNHGARVLTSGNILDIKAPSFFIARTDFAKEHPEAVESYLKVIQKAIDYQKDHIEEVAAFVANLKKADKAVIERVIRNSEPLNIPISKEILEVHQKSADILFDTGFIQKKVDVTKNVDNTFIEKIKGG